MIWPQWYVLENSRLTRRRETSALRACCFLNQVYGLRRDKVSLGCDKKFFINIIFLLVPRMSLDSGRNL